MKFVTTLNPAAVTAISLLIFKCFFPANPVFSQTIDNITKDEIVQSLDAFKEENRLTSLSFCMFQGYDFWFDHSSGQADIARKIPATSDHIYTLASVTKPITAMTLLNLVNQNQVSLGDSVCNIIPGFPANITVADLLNHTSGFLREKESEKYLSNSDYVDILEYLPVKFRLKIHRYANYNYAAAGAVIEKVAQKKYGEAARDYFYSVTGETLYFSNHPHSGDPRFVTNYVRRGRRAYEHELIDFGLWEPAAFAQTSSKALAKFMRAHMTPAMIQLLEENSVTIKKRRSRTGHILRDCYALGFRLRYVDDELCYIYHNGFLYGVLSSLYYFPKQDMGFAALSNMSYYPKQRVAMSGIYKSIEKVVDSGYQRRIATYAAENGYVAGAIFYEKNRQFGDIRKEPLKELAQSYLDAGNNSAGVHVLKLLNYVFPGSENLDQYPPENYVQVDSLDIDEYMSEGGGQETGTGEDDDYVPEE